MSVRLEDLVKDSCRHWIRDVTAPADLADRILADRVPAARASSPRRRRPGRFAVPLAAVATVLVVALALVLTSRIGRAPTGEPPAAHHDLSTQADPAHDRPTRLLAAGQVALGAYQGANGTWYVHDGAKDDYVAVPWRIVAVAPGLGRAAVLERSGTQRVGLLDLSNMTVTRWLPTSAPVSSADWSPDGRRLALTVIGRTTVAGAVLTARTGYLVVDVATGHSTFHRLPATAPTTGGVVDTMALGDVSTQAVSWSRTGRLVWVPRPDLSGNRDFYDLRGRRATPPGHEGREAVDAPISPAGSLIATTGAEGHGAGPAVSITDLASGARTAVLVLEHAVVWADDSHVVGVACDPRACTGKGEFHNRYVLAGLDGSLVPLTAYGDSESARAWFPQFVPRWPTTG